MTELMDGTVTEYDDAAQPVTAKRRGRPKGSKNKPKEVEEEEHKEGAIEVDTKLNISNYTRWLRVDLVVEGSSNTLGARISKDDIVAVSELPSGSCVVVMKANGAQQPLVFNVATSFVEVEQAITTHEW